jgi:hypothetical protein
MVIVAALAGAASAAVLARRRRGGSRAAPALAMVSPAPVRRTTPLFTASAPPQVASAGGKQRQQNNGARERPPAPRPPERRPRPVSPAPEPPRKPRSRVAPPPEPPPRPVGPVHDPPAKPRSRAAPPDPAIAWTAEIDWREKDGTGRFRVVATAQDGRTAVVAQSAVLEWPPRSPEAVKALTAAADRLEASLVAAGWRKLTPGASWYARRFDWEPARAGTRPAEAPGGSGRFRRARAWPSGTEERWRCEITWHAGYLSSYFEATVYPPGRKRGKPIAASERFKWLLMGDPEPSQAEHLREARRLATALRDAGWKRLDGGSAWYAARFIWPGEDAPPERLELTPEIEGGSR